jgi:hypothetical protein
MVIFNLIMLKFYLFFCLFPLFKFYIEMFTLFCFVFTEILNNVRFIWYKTQFKGMVCKLDY